MNSVNLIGRLTNKVELIKTSNNKTFSKFSLAVQRKLQPEQTDFIRCIAWDKKAELLNKYTQKGNLLGISGEIRTGKYENSEGKNIYTTEVNVDTLKFLSPKSS